MRRTAPARWPLQEHLARDMRKHMTPAEAQLWASLRNRGLRGLKFRRQHPIGRYIVDFYCVEAALVVEVDGPIHRRTRDEDRQRDAWLREQNVRVIRLTNEDVAADLAAALKRIATAAAAPYPPSPSPP